MEVSDKFHAQFALLKVKEPRYPLNTRPSGPKASFGDNRNLLPLPRIEQRFAGCLARRLVTLPIELPEYPESCLRVKNVDFLTINSWLRNAKRRKPWLSQCIKETQG